MRPGKGSHSVWEHPLVPSSFLTLSGNDGDDAKRYQERKLREFLDQVKTARRREER